MKPIYAGAAIAAASLLATPALAQDWKFTVTPYFWMAGLNGDIAPFPKFPVAHTDQSFGDILDDFQTGGALAFNAQHGKWSVLGDVSYIDTDSGRQAVSASPDYTVAGLESKATWLTGAIGYRVAETPAYALDLFGGVRMNWQDNAVRLVKTDNTQLNGDHDENWTDPIIGARIIAPLAPKWDFTGMADAGGFGVGSRLTYQLYAAATYRLSDRWSLTAGYRYMSVDYRNDGFISDIVEQGPILGTQFRF